MPNGRDHLEYKDFGAHDYHEGSHKCKHGCESWMGSAMSGAPAGVDPFGKCPSNYLKDIPESFGRPLSEKEILNDFINGRIESLSRKINHLEPFKKTVEESKKVTKVWLVTRVEYLEKQNKKYEYRMARIKEKILEAARE